MFPNLSLIKTNKDSENKLLYTYYNNKDENFNTTYKLFATYIEK